LFARLSNVDARTKALVAGGKLFRTSLELIPEIQHSSIIRNLGGKALDARGPAVVALALLGNTRPEAVDVPMLSPDTFNEETGIMRLDFAAQELRGDAASPPLSDGALAVVHKVGAIRHNARHALDRAQRTLDHATDLADLLDVPDEPDDTEGAQAGTKTPLSL